MDDFVTPFRHSPSLSAPKKPQFPRDEKVARSQMPTHLPKRNEYCDNLYGPNAPARPKKSGTDGRRGLTEQNKFLNVTCDASNLQQ